MRWNRNPITLSMGVFPLPIETFGHSNDAAAKDDDPGVSESRPTMIWIGLNYTLGEKSFNITIFTSFKQEWNVFV